MLRLVMAIVLAVMLAACSVAGSPSQALVKKAIELQLEQTQAELSQQIYRTPTASPSFKLNHVTVTQQEPLVIEDLTAYRVRGTYDVTQKLNDRRITQHQNPFEIYLQRQIEGKTWRLAHLQRGTGETSDRWITQLIQ
ncbi:hypothetical protein IQ268_22975 [Oculatella sp. LEGE 06141]|uniref:hypothetical protein n=1 Tax=Oculatella sp. LEGE 06141 TaxID=1828648 RepID=UPI001882A64B|nr:hypothetical protein [Oculatella sp. LEGE 06141]MBE9181430.1 hypothetical protein [Oculatella sp. LEGE 06141]